MQEERPSSVTCTGRIVRCVDLAGLARNPQTPTPPQHTVLRRGTKEDWSLPGESCLRSTFGIGVTLGMAMTTTGVVEGGETRNSVLVVLTLVRVR